MISEVLDAVVTTILSVVQSWGYLGIFVLMTIESSIIPLPAELILIPAGALVADGTFSGILVLGVAIAGSIVGALCNYALAYYVGRKPFQAFMQRYGNILLINEKTLARTERYFKEHGHITTLVGRLIPGIRSFISLPAGFARMNVVEFCVYTGIGAGVWSALLITIGYLAGANSALIQERLNSLTLILIVCAGIIVALYIRKSHKLRARASITT